MAYRAMDVAKYVVNYCASDGINNPISNLQLQKILYYIQHAFLIKGEGLTNEAFGENMYAWKYGPVEPGVYERYCTYGSKAIDDCDEKSVIVDSDDIKIINDVVNAKLTMSPWGLVEATHKKGEAWDKIYNNGRGVYKVIPKVLIKNNVELPN